MRGISFNAKRALLLAGMQLGIPAAIEIISRQPATVPLVPRPREMRGRGNRPRPFVGRTQELIADRSSSIRKLQRSRIPLMEGDERTLARHIHPRRMRAATASPPVGN